MDGIAASLVHGYLDANGFQNHAKELRQLRNIVDLNGKIGRCALVAGKIDRISPLITAYIEDISELLPIKEAFPGLQGLLRSNDNRLSKDARKVMEYVFKQDF